MEHECIIGLYHDVDIDRLITFGGIKHYTSFYPEIEKLTRTDPVYAEVYFKKRYRASDYFDKRKSTNLRRFEYCPDCGKRIDWKRMREEYKKDS